MAQSFTSVASKRYFAASNYALLVIKRKIIYLIILNTLYLKDPKRSIAARARISFVQAIYLHGVFIYLLYKKYKKQDAAYYTDKNSVDDNNN